MNKELVGAQFKSGKGSVPLCLLALAQEGCWGPKLFYGACPGLALSPCVFHPGVCTWDLVGREMGTRNPRDTSSLRRSERGGVRVGLVLAHLSPSQDTEDLDHYEMKEEEPADGKKTEDEGIGKENLAILEKIKKNQRQDYLNVRVTWRAAGLGKQRDPRAGALEAPASPKSKGPALARGTAAAQGWAGAVPPGFGWARCT